MYCFLLPIMVGCGYLLYFLVRFVGGDTPMTKEEILITLAGTILTAAAAIITAIITNYRALRNMESCVETTKEVLVRATDDKCNILTSGHNSLSSEHSVLMRDQNKLLFETRKVSDYVTRQEAIANAASRQEVNIQEVIAQITDLARRLADAEGQVLLLKSQLEEKESALQTAEEKIRVLQQYQNHLDEEDIEY